MATHKEPPSTRHNVLDFSPRDHDRERGHDQFAVLPDLPSHRTELDANTRPRSHTSSSHDSTLEQSLSSSAPTSPLSRPQGYSSLGLITPLDLPGPSTHVPTGSMIRSMPISHVPAPQIPRHSGQPIMSSFFPPANRVYPSGPSGIRQPQAPLSSTNLASLDKSTRTRSKSRSRVTAVMSDSGSGSETEKGGSDSDVTVIDHRRAGKASYSQTDIAGLQNRMTGYFTATTQVNNSTNPSSGIAKFRDTDTITLPRHGRRLTPPKPDSRPLPHHSNSVPSTTSIMATSPGKSPKSKSSTSLNSMRKSPSQSPRHPSLPLGRSPTTSPRHSSRNLAPLTPMTSSTSISLSPVNRHVGIKGGGSDADAEYDSLTDDSSVSFNTKRHSAYGIRHRRNPSTGSAGHPVGGGNGLGLSLGADSSDSSKVDDLIPEALERMYRSSSLLYLRILAIVPACWGTLVLTHGVVSGGIWHDVWPWGADFSAEAMYSRSHGTHMEVGIWKSAIRGDLLLAIAWAILTGHFCFRFTTGLTYRWRSYYDLLPVLVRLLALQALCWPATYITLSYLGPSQPLFAWAVIGVSTGITYAIIMWLASNVLPDPDDDRSRTNSSRSRSSKGSRTSSSSDHTPTRDRKNKHRYRPKAPVFPVWGEAPLIAPPEPPPHLTWWERLNYKRRWDWEAVAREVGWKVGALLLLTSAWVFWQVHIGWLVRPDQLES